MKKIIVFALLVLLMVSVNANRGAITPSDPSFEIATVDTDFLCESTDPDDGACQNTAWDTICNDDPSNQAAFVDVGTSTAPNGKRVFQLNTGGACLDGGFVTESDNVNPLTWASDRIYMKTQTTELNSDVECEWGTYDGGETFIPTVGVELGTLSLPTSGSFVDYNASFDTIGNHDRYERRLNAGTWLFNHNHPAEAIRCTLDDSATNYIVNVDSIEFESTPHLDLTNTDFNLSAQSGNAVLIQAKYAGGGNCQIVEDVNNDVLATMTNLGSGNYQGSLTKTVPNDANYTTEAFRIRCDNYGDYGLTDTTRGFIHHAKWFTTNLIKDGDMENCDVLLETCSNLERADIITGVSDTRFGFTENFNSAGGQFASLRNTATSGYIGSCPNGNQCFSSTVLVSDTIPTAGTYGSLQTIDTYKEGIITFEVTIHDDSLGGANFPIDGMLNFFHGGTELTNTASMQCTQYYTGRHVCEVALTDTDGILKWRFREQASSPFISNANIDNIRWSLISSTLTLTTNQINNQEIPEDTNIVLSANYVNDLNAEPIQNADCNLFAGLDIIPMSYNGATQTYDATLLLSSAGDYLLSATCQATGFNTQTDSELVTVVDEEFLNRFDNLIVTDISNVTHDTSNKEVELFPINDALGDVSFTVQNNNDFSFDLNYFLDNPDTALDKEYYIFSSISDVIDSSGYTKTTTDDWENGVDQNTQAINNSLQLVPTVDIISTLFTEDFNDNNITRVDVNWDIEDLGNWDIINGRLRRTDGSGEDHFIYEVLSKTDFTLSADFNFNEADTREMMLVGRHVADNNYFSCTYSAEENAVDIIYDGGTNQTLNSAFLVLPTDVIHTMSFTMNGTNISCTVNNTTITATTPHVHSGNMGLIARGAFGPEIGTWDNFKIQESTLVFPDAGSYTSEVIDLLSTRDFTLFTSDEDLNGGAVQYFARSGSTAFIDASWSSFVDINSSLSSLPNGQFIQFKLDLNKSISETSPVINSITLTYDVNFTGGADIFRTDLTFGDTDSGDFIAPLQRVWDNLNQEYVYSFERFIAQNELQPYSINYMTPMLYLETLSDDPRVLINPVIQQIDLNGRLVDKMLISNLNPLNIEFAGVLPTLTSTPDVKEEYVLRFNAFHEAIGADINITVESDAGSYTLEVTQEQQTFAVDISGEVTITSEDPQYPTIMYIEHFHVSQRGLFSKELELFDFLGDNFPLYNEGTDVFFGIKEGEKIQINTELYDRDGVLQNIVVDFFVSDFDPQNRVQNQDLDISNTLRENRISVIELVDGVETTSTEISDVSRLRVRVSAFRDVQGELVKFAEQERADYRLFQYPHFTTDSVISVFENASVIHEMPNGKINIKTNNPDAFQYFDLRFIEIDGNIEDPLYDTKFFNGIDFDLPFTGEIDLAYELDDWIFPVDGQYIVQATAKYETALFDLSNELLFDRAIVNIERKRLDGSSVLFLAFDGRRGIEGNPFDEALYTSTDAIPLIFEMRGNTNLPLEDKAKVRLRVQDLSGSSVDAVEIAPDFYRYDSDTSQNLWIWDQVLYTDGQVPLFTGFDYRVFVDFTHDLNEFQELDYIGLSDINESVTFTRTSTISPVQKTDEIILTIDDAYGPDEDNIPITLSEFGCYKDVNSLNNLNDVIEDVFNRRNSLFGAGLFPITTAVDRVTLQQNFTRNNVCAGVWADREFGVDTVRITILNEFSDETELDPRFAQYARIEIPSEQLLFAKQVGFVDQTLGILNIIGVDTNSEELTVGEWFVSVINRIGRGVDAAERGFSEFNQNIFGFTNNPNFEAVVAEQSGLVRGLDFRIEGLRMINYSDAGFKRAFDFEAAGVPQDKLIQYLVSVEGVDPESFTKARLIASLDGREVGTFEFDNHLVIDKAVEDALVSNNGTQYAPINYTVKVDLLYDNSLSSLPSQVFKSNDYYYYIDRAAAPASDLVAFIDDPFGFIEQRISVEFIIGVIILLFIIVFFLYIYGQSTIGNTPPPQQVVMAAPPIQGAA